MILNKYYVRSIFILMGIGLIGCNNSSSDDPQITPPQEKVNKVLIIGIDGCRPDGITASETPNLDKLMANGTFSLDARCLFTTSSGPGWTSMLSGVWQDKHNVTNNAYTGANFVEYPHFFKYVEDSNPNLRTVSIVEWNPINDQMAQLEADKVLNASSDENVKNLAADELTSNDPDALFLQFSNVDYAGHGTGFTPENPNYINAIEEVDIRIGAVLDAMQARETYENENWLILLSTDHGGLGTTHGGPSDEERTIFVIASGDDIPYKKIEKTSSQVTVPPVDNCLNTSNELEFKNTVLKVENNDKLNFGSQQDFSIECRIRSKIPGDVHVLGKKNWTSGYNTGWVFSFKPSSKKFKINVGDGTNRVDVEASEITDNEWHTVSATFDRDGLLKVFIDGEFVESTSMVSIGDISNSFPFTMGLDGNLNYPFQGHIAEVRVFNSLLSDEEISDWSCKSLNSEHTKYDSLVGHWKMDEGEGAVIADTSSNNFDGVLTDGHWKDATASTIETVHNFDETPRTVDVAVSALNHLCVPINPAWNLEGVSLVATNCVNE